MLKDPVASRKHLEISKPRSLKNMRNQKKRSIISDYNLNDRARITKILPFLKYQQAIPGDSKKVTRRDPL